MSLAILNTSQGRPSLTGMSLCLCRFDSLADVCAAQRLLSEGGEEETTIFAAGAVLVSPSTLNPQCLAGHGQQYPNAQAWPVRTIRALLCGRLADCVPVCPPHSRLSPPMWLCPVAPVRLPTHPPPCMEVSASIYLPSSLQRPHRLANRRHVVSKHASRRTAPPPLT